jgi:hypothetical protein
LEIKPHSGIASNHPLMSYREASQSEHHSQRRHRKCEDG